MDVIGDFGKSYFGEMVNAKARSNLFKRMERETGDGEQLSWATLWASFYKREQRNRVD